MHISTKRSHSLLYAPCVQTRGLLSTETFERRDIPRRARIGVKTPPDASCEKTSLAHLVAGFVDPDRSFATTAELEHQDPSDLLEVLHGSGAEFITGDSREFLRGRRPISTRTSAKTSCTTTTTRMDTEWNCSCTAECSSSANIELCVSADSDGSGTGDTVRNGSTSRSCTSRSSWIQCGSEDAGATRILRRRDTELANVESEVHNVHESLAR